MFKRLCRSDSIIGVVDEKLHDQVLGIFWNMGYQLWDSSSFLWWKVELHVRGMLLESVKQFLLWCSKNIMNFVNLIELVVSWKQRN